MFPRQASGIKIHTVLDEMVLYAPKSDMAFALNHSARAIWELCDGSHSVPEICQQLAQQFNHSSADLLPDVEETLRQLQEFSLLEFMPERVIAAANND